MQIVILYLEKYKNFAQIDRHTLDCNPEDFPSQFLLEVGDNGRSDGIILLWPREP